MSDVIAWEVQFFLRSIVWGIAFIVVYDVLRIFRRVVPHGSWWMGVEDIIYWLAIGIACFYFMFLENDGAIRWYALLGIGLGMLLWNVTVSSYVVRGISFALIKVLGLLSAPFRFAVRKIRNLTDKSLKKIKTSFTMIVGCDKNGRKKNKKEKKEKLK